ncbi:fusion protein [Salem virus]|uniref:Fusion glycoprotein F0 n=1 Tax=Salem virus TaxID=120499 RepID=I6TRF9_9MONO|nr:fusion protein [Salem virus]AFM97196.1 fusion protein [Salem virus]
MNPLNQTLIAKVLGFLLLSSSFTVGQIGFENLTRIGVHQVKQYGYKLAHYNSHQLLLIRMIPTVNGTHNCTHQVITRYREMVREIITPIKGALDIMKKAVSPDLVGARIFGAIVAGAALGIATSAQITAGVALHRTKLNGQEISKLKEAVSLTNEAVEQLQYSQGKSILAIQGIQDFINFNVVPLLEEHTCGIAKLHLEMALMEYFQKLILVFGPNLRDPIGSTIGIQALATLFQNNMFEVSLRLGYAGDDLEDVLQSNSIRANIIEAEPDSGFIVLAIRYPTLTLVEDQVITELAHITFNDGPQEWVATIPQFVTYRGLVLANIDVSTCTFTERNVICARDQTYPMIIDLQLCMRGNIAKCGRTRVTGSTASRFLLKDGNMYANCIATMCRCMSSSSIINQEPSHLTTLIVKETCSEVMIDTIRITLGERKHPPIDYQTTITLGQPIALAPLDVGTELANAVSYLNKSKVLLEHSNEVLSSVSTAHTSLTATIVLGIVVGGLAILIVVMFLFLEAQVIKVQRAMMLCPITNHGYLPNEDLLTRGHSIPTIG